MKKIHMLLSLFSLAAITAHASSTADQKFDAKLNALQELVATVIQQSNIDPQTAQDLLDQTNELNQYLQNNIQQDVQEIRTAAALTSILETVDKMAQNKSMTNVHTFLSPIKYAARTNVIHKLLIGMYPGQFKDEQYYTNPYLESIGFIGNDWALSMMLNSLLTKLAPTTLGTALQLDPTSGHQKMLSRIIAGIAAHYAWLLEKKYAFAQVESQAQN